MAEETFWQNQDQGHTSSCHDVAHLHPPTNIPAECQFPISYGFYYIPRQCFKKSICKPCKVIGQIMVTPQDASVNFLHFTISKI